MKDLTQPAAMTKASCIVAILLAAQPARAAAPQVPCDSGAAAAGYPQFCSIPDKPANVRDAAAFKAAVVDVRRAGRALSVARARAPGSLAGIDTDSFAQAARTEATPPAAAVDPWRSDTRTFADEAFRRARATVNAPASAKAAKPTADSEASHRP